MDDPSYTVDVARVNGVLNRDREERQQEFSEYLKGHFEFSVRSEPPTDFRTLSVVPTVDDLANSQIDYLRPALYRKNYDNVEHYLDVTFRLFREDFMCTFRDGLYNFCEDNQIIRQLERDDIAREDLNIQDIRVGGGDIRVFGDVRLFGAQCRPNDGERFHFADIGYSVGMRIVDWSQVAKHGQLVIFSSDSFKKELIIGLVVERPDGWDQRVGVAFKEEDEERIRLNVAYEMAESNAFFAMYQFVLEKIRDHPRHFPIPLERYIVAGATDVRRPLYQLPSNSEVDAEIALRNSEIVEQYATAKKEGLSRDRRRKLEEQLSEWRPQRLYRANEKNLHKVAIRGETYRLDKLYEEYKKDDLDESQLDALQAALCQELCLIQGPPGTGKTYIGVRIVETLLENRIRWGLLQPIIVVCFTNQALDQFLEKVYEVIKRMIADGRLSEFDARLPIIRMGSRSESEIMIDKKFILRDAVQDAIDRKLVDARESGSGRLYRQRESLKWDIGEHVVVLRDKSRLPCYRFMRPVMTQNQCAFFDRLRFVAGDVGTTHFSNDEMTTAWLTGHEDMLQDIATPNNVQQRSVVEKMREVGVGGWLLTGNADNGQSTSSTAKQAKKSAKKKNKKNAGTTSAMGDNEADDLEVARITNCIQDLTLNGESSTSASGDRPQSSVSNRPSSIVDGIHYEIDEQWYMEEKEDLGKSAFLMMDRFVKYTRTGKGAKNGTPQKPNEALTAALEKAQLTHQRTDPMTGRRADEVGSDLFQLSLAERWALARRWAAQAREAMIRKLAVHLKEYRRICLDLKDKRTERDATVLRSALIVGATTTGASKYAKLLDELDSQVMIVEEAAEVLEAHVLTACQRSLQHLIMIGDHQQLRPKPASYTLASCANLDVSMFERLIAHNHPYSQLQIQHRMRPNVTEHIVRRHFYEKVQDGGRVYDYPEVPGMQQSLFFVSHQAAESYGSSLSHKNEMEADFVLNLVDYILAQGKYRHEDITIVSAYGAQTEYLRDNAMRRYGLDKGTIAYQKACANGDRSVPRRRQSNVNVYTLDGFQGQENKVIVLSLVRSRPPGAPVGTPSSIGFLKTKNRVCVALTRSQHALYAVGNFEHLMSQSELWRDIINDLHRVRLIDYTMPVVCQRHGFKQEIGSPKDFLSKTLFGGCGDQCDFVFECRHICRQHCNHDNCHREPHGDLCPKCDSDRREREMDLQREQRMLREYQMPNYLD